MATDKNQAIIDYLITCPVIQNNPLYFNYINAKDSYNQIVTMANDLLISRPYLDGSVRRRYTFNIITFKSMADTAVVKQGGYSNENVEDMVDPQAIIDWIADQQELHNYPDFGEDNIIESIDTTTSTPVYEGVNTSIDPPLAMYSVSVRVDYIDNSKVIWN